MLNILLQILKVFCSNVFQIDFASRDCQNLFFENMERTGQLRPGDRADDRAARGYTGFTEYQRRPNPNRCVSDNTLALNCVFDLCNGQIKSVGRYVFQSNRGCCVLKVI